MVLCGLGMQQCAMHNATVQKTTFFELGVYIDNQINHIERLTFENKACRRNLLRITHANFNTKTHCKH